VALPEPSDLEAAVRRLPAGWSGTYLATTLSTQDEARRLAVAGAPSRTLVVADVQHAGRGRQGRTWLASPGVALLVSIVLRVPGPPRPWRSTALASVALVEAIEQIAPGLRPAIKWPNDVLLDGRKVAGILAEATFDGQQQTAIVGLGTNVATPAAELAGIGQPVTSLSLAAGRPVERGRLLLALTARLDAWLERPEEALRQRWEERLWGRGQRLRLAEIDGERDVVVLGVEPDGALRVRLVDGRIIRTVTGELIL
jgi:BirA family biotin operon repressor/biotin-[acetyl-CoA-carboxylase] ligase